MKPIYYFILGTKECITRPLARFETLEEAQKEVRTYGGFCLTSGEYKKLTGRNAYRDFLKDNQC